MNDLCTKCSVDVIKRFERIHIIKTSIRFDVKTSMRSKSRIFEHLRYIWYLNTKCNKHFLACSFLYSKCPWLSFPATDNMRQRQQNLIQNLPSRYKVVRVVPKTHQDVEYLRNFKRGDMEVCFFLLTALLYL